MFVLVSAGKEVDFRIILLLLFIQSLSLKKNHFNAVEELFVSVSNFWLKKLQIPKLFLRVSIVYIRTTLHTMNKNSDFDQQHSMLKLKCMGFFSH